MPYDPSQTLRMGNTVRKMLPGGGYDPGAGGNINPLIPDYATDQLLPDFSTLPQIRDPYKQIGGHQTLIPELKYDPTKLAGYENLLDLATGEGLTKYAQAASDALKTQTGFKRDEATKYGQSMAAQAAGNIARQRGLTGGASERLQRRGLESTLLGRQNIAKANLLGQKDIALQDAAARRKGLGSLLELGAGAEKFNIGNVLADIQAERNYEIELARMRLEKYMAEQKAREMGYKPAVKAPADYKLPSF